MTDNRGKRHIDACGRSPATGKFRQVIDMDEEKLKALWASPLHCKIVEYEMGVRFNTLVYRARKLGLPTRRRTWALRGGYGEGAGV